MAGSCHGSPQERPDWCRAAVQVVTCCYCRNRTIVSARRRERPKPATVLCGRSLTGSTLRLRPRHAATAADRAVVSARRRERPEAATVLCWRRLTGSALRFGS